LNRLEFIIYQICPTSITPNTLLPKSSNVKHAMDQFRKWKKLGFQISNQIGVSTVTEKRSVDVANNKYYDDLHKRLEVQGKTVYSCTGIVTKCGKCHY